MKKRKKIKILFLPPQTLPIPAVGGGAIETILSSLIKENEELERADFVVVSKYYKDAYKHGFQHTKIYYFDDDNCLDKNINSKTLRIAFSFHRFFRIFLRFLFANRITIKIFKKNILMLNYFLYQVLYIARKEKIDYFINESFNYDVGKVSLISRSIGINKMIYHAHCVDNAPADYANSYSLLIGISDFVTREWLKTSPGLKGRTLYNGINIMRYSIDYSYYEKKNLRESLGLKPSDFVVLFVGRIIPEKGIKELILSFNRLKNKRIKLIVIGTPFFSSKKTTIFAEKMIEAMDKNDNIKYLGYIGNDQIPIYQSIANVQIVPSMWEEGAGLVSIEAMASGLPLIITNSGGMPEYTGTHSVLIVERNADLIKNINKSILKLMNDEELCKRLGKNGKSRAALFTEREMYLKFMRLLEDKWYGNY